MNIVIQKEDAREVIEKHFGVEIRRKLPKIIYDAYFWSHRIIENTSMLNWIRGKSLLPNIKNIAVEFFIVQEIKNGNLPFQWRVNYTTNKSASFIEIFNDSILLHVNQVANKKKIARPAFCRDQYIQSFQSYIEFQPEISTFDQVNKKPQYFQLNHGYQSIEPLFISLGIPGDNRKWIDNIQLLNELVSIEGRLPKSKVENIEGFSLEDFQQFADEVDSNDIKGFGS